ncbi:MAG: YegS/Rv2252/BmrU family lipid kinase [Actinobacteria bacterium]|nr:YegS/Rv2252/BmrU family lipid kinase [Actinomycetota bacterium]
MKTNLVLANPTSGRGKGARVLGATLKYLDSQHSEYQVIAASSLDASLNELHATSLSDVRRILVIGGDGMMHHVINAMKRHPDSEHSSELPIGLVPAGTGNDFARALGLDLKDPERNLDHFLARAPHRVDLGQVNGRLFGAICSTGFDSIVNERANQMRWPEGKRKYDLAMLQELPRFKARSYHIAIDDASFEVQAMLIAVGNGSSYGGGMKVCPNADLTDGLLDVMILHPVPKGEFLRMFPKVYSGKHVHHPKVQIIRGKRIQIHGEAITYADGERIAATPVTIDSITGALLTWSVDQQR